MQTNSALRLRYAAHFEPAIDWRRNRFVWLGTTCPFPAFTFIFKESEHGLWRVHAYRYDAHDSTFIVETPESVWRFAGEALLAFMRKAVSRDADFDRWNAGDDSAMSALWERFDGAGYPDGMIGDLIERDFGSFQAWRTDLKATGMAGRGWAWTAYDWDEGRLFNYIGDAQNTFPIWNATPLVALDVYEHAYFLDYQTDRASYIDAFFDNLDWSTVNDWVSKYQIQK